MTPTSRVLLTGFEPFAGDRLNPSALIVEALAGTEIAGARVEGRILPCVFGRAIAEAIRAVDDVTPEVVIALGQAGGRTAITVERVAINVDDARIPDNAGAQPIDRPILADGPAAYFSTLPIKAMVAALQERGIAAAVSQTAGTFVCNHVFYGLRHHLAHQPHVRAGFVHVPWLPEQAAARPGDPSLPLAVQVEAVRVLVAVALTAGERRLAGGAEH
jgi:pyroglutamyl-peptidase